MREDWVKCSFEDLLKYEQPTKYIVQNTDYNDSFKIPVLTAGKSFVLGYTNEKTGIFKKLPVIIFDDFTTSSKFVNFRFKVKSSAMKILLPTSELVNMKFTFYYMQVNKIRSDTHKRYWISIYAKKQIYLPPLPEQHRIVAKIEELFSKLDNVQESINQLQGILKPSTTGKIYQLRQSILKKAFEGNLVPQDPNDEPASELLKRIKANKEG